MKKNGVINSEKNSFSASIIESRLNILLKTNANILSQLSYLNLKIETLENTILKLTADGKNQQQIILEPIRGIKGLAQFLGVSHVTAQKIKNSGKIPFAQYERVILFDPAKVLSALENLK